MAEGPPRAVRRRGYLLRRPLVDVAGECARTLAGELEGDGLREPVPAARDDDDLALELAHAALLPVAVPKPPPLLCRVLVDVLSLVG